MNATLLLFGILPLLAFVIIESISGVKAGVISAMLFAIAEAAYTLIVYQTIDNITIGSTILVLIFGLLSYRLNNAIYIKLQPTVLGVLFGLVFLIMQMLGKPLMVLMVEKYQFLMPEEFRAMALNPGFLSMLARLSGVLGFGFLIHAAIVAYSAFYMNKWWWIIIRGIGLYVMLAICTIYVRFA